MSGDPRVEAVAGVILAAQTLDGEYGRDAIERVARLVANAHLAAADAVDPYRQTDLAELLGELVEIIDPEEGSWPQDMSTCPYYRRGLPDADPEGTCAFGCTDEPQCQTCRPEGGWPIEHARRFLATLDPDPQPPLEPLQPST